MSEESSGGDAARAVSPWWGVAAVVIAVVPFALQPALVRLPFVIVALTLGVWAVVAALKTRSNPARRRTSSILAVVAVLAAVVMVIATIVGVNAERNRPRLVSIEASGSDIMRVNYDGGEYSSSEIWGSGDRHSFGAEGTRATVHVTAQIGPAEPLTCKIYIDNELVVTEVSTTDEVSCTYVYPWLK
ncbi:hypothetical protein AB0O87_11545 [Microbacterium sp. NPDC076768]|uniref:hypothetical protein n=1 Tax=Microbacterium sp. NPDC076768 TaxID=3154858 RepID=UPI00341E5CE5